MVVCDCLPVIFVDIVCCQHPLVAAFAAETSVWRVAWFGSVFASALVLNSAKVGRGLDDLGVSVVVTVSMFGWHLVLEY